MFRECFPHSDRPSSSSANKDSNLYLSWLEEWCSNVEYRVKLLEFIVVPERVTYYGRVWYAIASINATTYINC